MKQTLALFPIGVSHCVVSGVQVPVRCVWRVHRVLVQSVARHVLRYGDWITAGLFSHCSLTALSPPTMEHPSHSGGMNTTSPTGAADSYSSS
jgi:hypothetical protein